MRQHTCPKETSCATPAPTREDLPDWQEFMTGRKMV